MFVIATTASGVKIERYVKQQAARVLRSLSLVGNIDAHRPGQSWHLQGSRFYFQNSLEHKDGDDIAEYPRRIHVDNKCGRLVAFSAGEENPHGEANKCWKGERCFRSPCSR